MSRIDAVYTPSWLASELADELPNDLTGAVVDPCVGEGALLAAVERRFGDTVPLSGIDIHSPTIMRLRAAKPNWVLSCGDSLSDRSLRSTRVMRVERDHVSAVVLNPPFSYRGLGGVRIEIDGVAHSVTPAAAFVYAALKAFQPSYGLCAILPDGALHGQRSEKVWASIELDYHVSISRSLSSSAFTSVRAQTAVVRVIRRSGAKQPAPQASIQSAVRQVGECRCVEIVRGRVPRFANQSHAGGDVAPYIHTTDIRALLDGTWSARTSTAHPVEKATEGPFVLLNRVGAFKRPVRFLHRRAVLSDCLYALRTPDSNARNRLYELLVDRSNELSALYTGTGAPYLTVRQLEAFLRAIGWDATFVAASDPPSKCWCQSQTGRTTHASRKRFASIA